MTGATLRGIREIAKLEVAAIARGPRRRRQLGMLAGGLALVVVGMRAVIGPHASNNGVDPGKAVFAWLTLLVLAVALLLLPVLVLPGRARAVPGDHGEGEGPTAAVVTLGRLAAAWTAGLALLGAAMPALIATALMGGVTPTRGLVTIAVTGVLLGVVAALLSACWGLRRPRRAGYLAVVGLVCVPGVAFAAGLAMTDGTHRYSYLEPVFDDDLKPTGAFRSFTRTKTGVDTAQVWWLLAPQPFAVLADATPRWRPRIDPDTNAFHPLEAGKYDPLSVIRDGVRDARTTRDEFADFDPYLLMGRTVDHYLEPAPTWPVGMLSDVLLGTGVALLRIRRLRRGPRRAAAERAPATTPTAP